MCQALLLRLAPIATLIERHRNGWLDGSCQTSGVIPKADLDCFNELPFDGHRRRPALEICSVCLAGSYLIYRGNLIPNATRLQLDKLASVIQDQ
jgi:hypothetical protein